MKRWVAITRAPFLTAAVIPLLLGGALAAGVARPFPWLSFVLALAGGMALHVASNLFNDYFDWTSGTDLENNDYFAPFSGGSRSIELGLITPAGLFRVAWAFLGAAAAVGVVLTFTAGAGVLLFGAAGAFAAYCYTAPPLRLSARQGLGELTVGLCFGPLMTAGAFYATTGQVNLVSFLVGVPPGALTAAILWINQFPDAAGDERAGKRNLVVVMGRRAARWGYVALVGVGYLAPAALAAAGLLPATVLAALLPLPLGVVAVRVLFAHYEDRALVRANQATIQLQLVCGLLMAAGLAW